MELHPDKILSLLQQYIEIFLIIFGTITDIILKLNQVL